MGGSIEDYDPDTGFYEIAHATERIAAGVEAARRLDFPFTLTARAENYFRDSPDLDDTLTRPQAYERAGADVLYAPRLPGAEVIRAIRNATTKPLNVLAGPDLSVAEIIESGGQRISVGGRLAWVAINSMAAVAEEVRDGSALPPLADPTQINEWLSA